VNVKRVGIVVPTLGVRLLLLSKCLKSIRQFEGVHICLVGPSDVDFSDLLTRGLVDQVVLDPGLGLAGAINFGILKMPESIKFVNWLGDDDVLSPKSLEATSSFLALNQDVAMVFGGCDYIDGDSRLIWSNKSGQWAVPLMRVGPCLVPQPGSLFRRNVFEELGGLNTSFKWAFDYEFFIRLSRKYEIRYLPKTLASFRWHSDSLSVGGRKGSVAEASKVRKMHLSKKIRPVSFLWEIPVKVATEYAGYFVSRNAAKPKRRNR
jgi:GT2 family glycosyltransferase